MSENVALKKGFSQVCVWRGTEVGASNIADFEAHMKQVLGVEVQYLEEIKTAPDMKNGFPVEGTGGRNDLFFAMKPEDAMKCALIRLKMGIAWVEDIYGNGYAGLYPERVKAYCSW